MLTKAGFIDVTAPQDKALMLLLEEILTQEKWRDSICTVDGGYDLVVAITQWYEIGDNESGGYVRERELYERIANTLPLMLAEWLYPNVVALTLSKDEFAGEVFGEVWRQMVWDVQPPRTQLSRFIRETKPQFVPAVLLVAQPDFKLDLPSLEPAV